MHLTPSARRQVLGAIWLVVLSGVLWIALGFYLDADDYTDPLRAWRHRVLVLHGIAAYVLLWVIGRLFALHQQGNWRAQRNRASGLALSLALLLLAGSGLTLYYPPHEDWRDAFSMLHQVLGVALVLLVPLHVVLARKDRQRRRAGQ
ncbi:MAG: cytochrome b/b6 domain-containing protein [Nitrosomonadales bacterium]|nr:cytochrome b/b6 domain-containing protein [Nitrosomonadales bacterium]